MAPVAWMPTRRDIARGLAAGAMAPLAPTRLGAQQPELADGLRVLRAGEARPSGQGDIRSGYNGTTPGPLLRIKQGEELGVRLINGLSKSTAIHWHGVRVPNILDGVPFVTQQPIRNGGHIDSRFIPPDAGTFWYHAPFVDQIDDGLYGPLIIDEASKPAVDRDIVLMLGRSGVNLVDANGAPLTEIAVRANERIRLRLINGLSTEVLPLRIEGHRATVMAIDGQPAEPFIANEGRLVLGPGNRIDVFIDALLSAGTATPLAVVIGSDAVLARIVYAAGAPARAAAMSDIAPLPANPLPQRMDFARALRREILVGSPGPEWIPVDRPADTPLAMFSANRGRTVMLALNNNSDIPRSVHLHGHSFRLLDKLDDGWKPFWLDTLIVPPGETVRIAFVADNRGTWAIENRALVAGDPGRLMLFDAV